MTQPILFRSTKPEPLLANYVKQNSPAIISRTGRWIFFFVAISSISESKYSRKQLPEGIKSNEVNFSDSGCYLKLCPHFPTTSTVNRLSYKEVLRTNDAENSYSFIRPFDFNFVFFIFHLTQVRYAFEQFNWHAFSVAEAYVSWTIRALRTKGAVFPSQRR